MAALPWSVFTSASASTRRPERASSRVRAISSSLEPHQAAQGLQFFHRTAARLNALLERMQPAFDLAQGFVVGKEIDLAAGQEVAALASFGIAHAGQEPLETELEFLGSQDFVAGIREQFH